MTPSNANTSGLGEAGLSETYRFAYKSVRNGAPGLSDATCAAIARSINMKVSLADNVTAASAQARIAEFEADAVRSEKHRNDLADKITSQSIELGALRSRINALSADTPHHLVLHDGTDAWCSAAAWKWFQAWSVRADEEASRATAAEARADRLAKALTEISENSAAAGWSRDLALAALEQEG